MLIAIGMIIISRRRKGAVADKIRNEDGSIATDYINDNCHKRWWYSEELIRRI